eukprot:CAMPEP_0194200188 /NCGR_PEP_ID=MMETSP0156-20130528/904_1 /TAXON_ID=33649 /ORGANISM="Thalassionema nitzschioides, Strain L26-B" /LENGTH=333 /DNA_ID=CAMNT_0038925155 /DNA_START=179 /DNA_END=1176 /DNA_ORIENTATION=-
MPHCKSKKNKKHRTRGSRGCKIGIPCIKDSNTKKHHDLMVLLPNDKEKSVRLFRITKLLDRLEFLGYSKVALVHQVFGTPKSNCKDTFDPYLDVINNDSKGNRRNLEVYYRLHCIVEAKSDLGFFTPNDIMDSYDLVSLAPQNDGILEAACLTATIDIITLDYSATNAGLPFKLRGSNVNDAMNNNTGLEILYGPSIVNTAHRKLLLQTLRLVESVSLGKKDLNVLVGSGTANPMALRSSGDICNVLEEVGRFKRARLSQSAAAAQMLERAWRRRMGFQQEGIRITNVRVKDTKNEESETRSRNTSESNNNDKNLETTQNEDENEADEGLGDG